MRRIQERSDDFEATAALGLVNRARLRSVGPTPIAGSTAASLDCEGWLAPPEIRQELRAEAKTAAVARAKSETQPQSRRSLTENQTSPCHSLSSSVPGWPGGRRRQRWLPGRPAIGREERTSRPCLRHFLRACCSRWRAPARRSFASHEPIISMPTALAHRSYLIVGLSCYWLA